LQAQLCYHVLISSVSHDTATTEIYTLSLHDALPISLKLPLSLRSRCYNKVMGYIRERGLPYKPGQKTPYKVSRSKIELFTQCPRSEEHTSELQSRENLVCRLLLEKKKINKKRS